MIKNLLFDLGGVIMDIDKNRCIAAFSELGMENPGRFFGDFSQTGPFMALERGDISVEEFHESLRPELPTGVTDAQIDAAFCRFLIGIPVRRLEDLKQLRRRFNIYLLSNTNQIMWDSVIKREFEKAGMCREDYFDGMVTSFDANSLKPESKIFEHCLEKFDIQADETLFLDDSSANLTAAARLGFCTALVAPGKEFSEILKFYNF